MTKITFTDDAKADIANAFEWFENKQPELGDRFLNNLDNCIESIKLHPKAHQIVYKKYRQAIVFKFEFVVIYKLYADKIIVFSVFHTAQNPTKKIRE